MAVYLGDQEVGLTKVIIPSNYITDEQLDDLKTAIEYRTGKAVAANAEMGDIVEQIGKPYGIREEQSINVVDGTSTAWTRPSGWPDLDSLNLEFSGNTDFLYMTYRTGHADDFCAFYIELVGNTGSATVDFGHISNGTYVVDSTDSVSHASSNYYYFNQESIGYTVVRITGAIKIFRLIGAATADGTPDSRTFTAPQQPMVERIAYVPNFTAMSQSSTTTEWGSYYLQRERVGNNTGAACTNMNSFYRNCYNLVDLDVSEFYTPNVTSFESVFSNCYKLKNIDLRHWVTNNVTTFKNLFNTCYSLTSLNVSNWETPKLTTLFQTFANCQSLQEIIGLENWNVSKVTAMNSTFSLCQSLSNLDGISNWNVSAVTTIGSAFQGMYCLEFLDLSKWNTASLTSIGQAWRNCYSLKQIKFPKVKTANLTDIYGAFADCWSLQSIDLDWLKMDAGTCSTIWITFAGCRSITELNFPLDWDTSGIANGGYSFGSMFSDCWSLKKITGIKDWDVSNVTAKGADKMFQNCYSLTEVDISGWHLSATSYASMFSDCYSLERIDISNFNFANCTSMAGMFNKCYSLKEIVFPTTMNTANVTTMASMFADCRSLPSISQFNITSWDFTKVTTIASMFANCYSLKSVSLNNLSLPACTTIATLFNTCYGLKELSWSGWSIPKVTTTAPAGILQNCWNLEKITGFPPFKLAFNMQNCYSLPADQIVGLFNNLATTSTSRTINMSNLNINKLSAAEKQIATSKGWTLAN